MKLSSCNAWCAQHGVSVGALILRVLVGFVMISSGATKLFGGMDMFSGMVANLGIPAPVFMAYAAALVEFVGGIAVLLGIGTRVFAALIAIVMAVAFFGAHGGNMMEGLGALGFLGIALSLVFTGPGRWSIDVCAGLTKDEECCKGNKKDCCKN